MGNITINNGANGGKGAKGAKRPDKLPDWSKRPDKLPDWSKRPNKMPDWSKRSHPGTSEDEINQKDSDFMAYNSDSQLNQTEFILKFLQSHTGMSADEIFQIFSEFMANKPDGQLNQTEFVVLYGKLRAEPYESLDEISKCVFKTFDKGELNQKNLYTL